VRFDDEMIVRKVIREEKLCVATPVGHPLTRYEGPLRLRHTAGEPLIIYRRTPGPSRTDQIIGFYRDTGVEPEIATEARELQTALDLVASGGGICIVPASVRRLGRCEVCYLDLDEPKLTTPIIMNYRKNDGSRLLQQLVTLVRQFDKWDASLSAAPKTG
jgi:LysR family transcriptional regulator, benzoate and cis,cis-muconate-responsive activator of ben and cat genes